MRTFRKLAMVATLFMVASAVLADEAKDKQLRKQFRSWKFGMFLHFNMATYYPVEWANGYEDPSKFNPDKLDCGQWADLAKSLGMKYAVLTVKHTGGWCLWDSAYTKHDATQFKNFKNGKGDIVKEFVKAFRKRGLKVGFYYCFPGDYACKEQKNLPPAGKPALHGLPPEAKGDYVGFMKKQLKELIDRYKPDLLWIDQYSNKYTGKDWLAIKSTIKKWAPNCIVIGNNAHNVKDSDVYSCEVPTSPDKYPPKNKPMPGEVCDKISCVWFWANDNEKTVKTPEQIAKELRLCRERDSNLLLNIPPDPHGLISGEHLKAALRFKESLKKDKDLAKYLGVK